MNFARLLSISIICCTLSASMASAQNKANMRIEPRELQPQTVKMIEQVEAMFVTSVRVLHPDFDYVKILQTYPERINATLPMKVIATSSEGERPVSALVTLHDGDSGAAIESCQTPCTLHAAIGQEYVLSSYRDGHVSAPQPVIDPQTRQLEEPDWHGLYSINAGFDFGHIEARRMGCEWRFARMDREDSDAVPCFRSPPLMPGTGFSGYCRVTFDIDATGNTRNLEVVECTDSVFHGPSLLAVSSWKYHPKIERGTPVPRLGVESKVFYNVTDYDGKLLDQNGQVVLDSKTQN